MKWIYYNPNPENKNVGDCTVRAISKLLNIDWESAYLLLCKSGYYLCDMPNTFDVLEDVLKTNGYKRHFVKNTCPDCYTVRDFCEDYSEGSYIVFSESHVVCIVDGDYYDAWDSGDKTIYFYFSKED